MIVTFGNLYYYPLKLYVFISSYLYFRKLRVVGRENIPANGPVIFAINHQNGLLDTLLLSVVSIRNPHFLTRADIFSNKLADKFMRGVKMLPVYRIRDGYDSVKMNQVIFESARDILLRGGTVGIFPEGTHGLKYKIKPLKKGFARIAFMAEAARDFNLNVQVVPIGIQYESHFFSSGRTLISFGKPINVADYKEVYLQDQNKAIDAITKKLSGSLKANIVHFESKENYDQVLKSFLEQRIYKRDLQKQLAADQALVNSLENGVAFMEKSDKKNPLRQILANTWLALWHIVSFIPGSIVNLMVKKMVRDPDFIGTMRYAFSIFLYPVIYLILYYLIRFLVL
jgi:1-acyl-sn-glycerol-3-phosphate acyltransferase